MCKVLRGGKDGELGMIKVNIQIESVRELSKHCFHPALTVIVRAENADARMIGDEQCH